MRAQSAEVPPFVPFNASQFSLRLCLAAIVCLSLAAFYGATLVETFLKPTQAVLDLVDPRFLTLKLEVTHDAQDTLVRLRTNLARPIVVGTTVTSPHPRGWLEVTTTVGCVLQPLLIALVIALAWPAPLRRSLAHGIVAMALGLVVLSIDLPLTLHAYVWDMFVQHYEPERFSPLMSWFRFMSNGGRLAIGVLLAAATIKAYAAAWGKLTRTRI